MLEEQLVQLPQIQKSRQEWIRNGGGQSVQKWHASHPLRAGEQDSNMAVSKGATIECHDLPGFVRMLPHWMHPSTLQHVCKDHHCLFLSSLHDQYC